MEVYLEVGHSRVFASALDWPGWSRSARTDAEALAALVRYGPRYAAAVGAGAGFAPPPDPGRLVVTERVAGGSGTDFGAPSHQASADGLPLDEAELERQGALLAAGWAAFDRAAASAVGHGLRKGPRGGGRDLEHIVSHVLEAEEAYFVRIGGSTRDAAGARLGPAARMASLRTLVLVTLADRAAGVPVPVNPRRTGALWPARYFIRRSAWHALDHAWEIEDRIRP